MYKYVRNKERERERREKRAERGEGAESRMVNNGNNFQCLH